MYPATALNLINLLEEHLPNHPGSIPLYQQILLVIRYLAEGSYQKGVETDLNHPLSQSSVSRYLHRVIPAINMLANRFIRFPRTPEERQAVQRRYIVYLPSSHKAVRKANAFRTQCGKHFAQAINSQSFIIKCFAH